MATYKVLKEEADQRNDRQRNIELKEFIYADTLWRQFRKTNGKRNFLITGGKLAERSRMLLSATHSMQRDGRKIYIVNSSSELEKLLKQSNIEYAEVNAVDVTSDETLLSQGKNLYLIQLDDASSEICRIQFWEKMRNYSLAGACTICSELASLNDKNGQIYPVINEIFGSINNTLGIVMEDAVYGIPNSCLRAGFNAYVVLGCDRGGQNVDELLCNVSGRYIRHDVTEGTTMPPVSLFSPILPRTSSHAQETVMPEISVLHSSSEQMKRYPICLKGFGDPGIVLARKIVHKGDSFILDVLNSFSEEKLTGIRQSS